MAALEPWDVSEEVGREAVKRCAAAIAAVIEEYLPAMRRGDPDAAALCRLADRCRAMCSSRPRSR
jgi:hypothetical protein